MLFASILGVYIWKKLNKKYRFLTTLLIIVTISEATSRVLIVENGSSFPIYHFLIPIQCLFYALIFGIFSKNKNLIGTIFSIAFLGSILNTSFNQHLYSFPTISLIFLSFAVVISVLFDFERIRKHPNEIQLVKMGDFWLNIGTLFFFSITFLGFSMMSIEGKQFPKWVYNLIYAANVSLYISYFAALYLERKPNDSINI